MRPYGGFDVYFVLPMEKRIYMKKVHNPPDMGLGIKNRHYNQYQ